MKKRQGNREIESIVAETNCRIDRDRDIDGEKVRLLETKIERRK